MFEPDFGMVRRNHGQMTYMPLMLLSAMFSALCHNLEDFSAADNCGKLAGKPFILQY